MDEVDDPGLFRTWEVIKECVIAHALVDRDEEQSIRSARAEAWVEFVGACLGRDSTFTQFGMASELEGACVDIGREDDLDEVIKEANRCAGGRRGWPTVTGVDGRPVSVLRLVWDRDLGLDN